MNPSYQEPQTIAELRAHYARHGVGRRPKTRAVAIPGPIKAPTITTAVPYSHIPGKKEHNEKIQEANRFLREAKATELSGIIKFCLPRMIAVVSLLGNDGDGLTEEILRGESGRAKFMPFRKAVYIIAYKHTFMSYAQIAKPFKRDHTTILQGIQSGMLDPSVLAIVARAEKILGYPADGIRGNYSTKTGWGAKQ